MTEFRYCPVCAGNLKSITREYIPRLVCEKCGYTLYENSRPCTTVLIEDNGKIMLTRRAINPYKGEWGLPGGFLENGEDPVEGAKREALEETGLEVDIIDMIGVQVDKYGENGVYTLNLQYLSIPVGGRVNPQSDVSEIRWFDPDEIPENIGFKNCRDAVEKWRNMTMSKRGWGLF